MTEAEIKAIVDQSVSAYRDAEVEINQCKEDCEQKIAEANAAVEAAVLEKNELQATVDELQAAIEKWEAEYKELNQKYSELWDAKAALDKALGEAKAKELIGEMNAAIADFSDAEKEYAKAEIDAFTADPENVEINSVLSKIYEGIGKAAKADADKKVAEQNAAQAQVEDIFSVVEAPKATTTEDVDIF